MNVENSQKRTPLLIALKLENVPLIQLLLKYGAHKNGISSQIDEILNYTTVIIHESNFFVILFCE